MRLERLEGEHLFAVSGLGASVILGDEAGLHVLETGDGTRGRSASVHASVHVVPWEPGPPGERATLIALARRALAEHAAPERVVRRYRRVPSPLVRDAVRGYRSGRLDRVLAGDFDVVG
jgi:ATP-dependent Clp protease ATP-binding subunit ClpC